MSNYIAQSTVLVRADTSPFRAQLERAIKQADGKKVTVQVVPTTVGFVRALNEQLKNLKGVRSVPVTVVPVLAPGFRNTVRAAVLQATEGLAIPVGVAPAAATTTRAARTAAAPTGGVATGGVVDKRVAAAQLAIATATDAGVAARRRFDKALSDSERQILRDVRVGEQLRTSTAAVSAAAKAGVPALQAEAEALHLTALRANERNEASKARAFARDPATIAAATEAAAAAEKKAAEEAARRAETTSAAQATAERKMVKTHIAALEENKARDAEAAARFTALQEERIAAVQAETAALAARARAVQVLPQVSGKTRTRDILGQTIAGGGAVIDNKAILQNLAFEDSLAAASRAETDFANARRATARAALFVDDAEKKVAATRAAERAAIDEVTDRTLAYNFAVASGSPARKAATAEELRLAEARLLDASAANKVAEAELVRSGQLGAARRAFEAFGATLAGLRGAALSAQGAFLAAGAAAIIVTKSVQSAAQFASTLNVFKVTASATADQMEKVSAAARSLGRDVTLPGVTAQDAADALTELSKAGLSVQDSLDGARGVLQLATAASIDNAQATQLAASALNAFGLSGDQAVHVADVLANAANASQGSIVDMGVALQQSAAVARQAGLSLEETVGALTLLARAGLRGSDAGTSLRTALIRLINPTSKASKEIETLGLHVRDASGAINLNVFSEFAAKTRDMTAAQRDQALAVIFGQDAIRAAAILAREGTVGLNSQIDALGKAGTAAELAAARNAGFAGSLENLKNQLTDAGITIGQVLIPPLSILVNRFSDVLKSANDMAAGFTNAAKQAEQMATGILDSAEKLSGLNLGGGGPKAAGDNKGFVSRVLGLIPGSDDPTTTKILTEVMRKSGEQAVKNISAPPVTGKFPIKLDFTTKGLNVKDAQKQIRDMVASLEAFGGATKFNETVIGLKKLSAQLRTGDKDAQKFSTDVDIFIKRLQDASAAPKLDLTHPDFGRAFDISLAQITQGAPGVLAAEMVQDQFVSTLSTQQTRNGRALFDALFGGFEENLGSFVNPLALKAAAAGDTVKQAFLDGLRVTTAEQSQVTNQLAATASAALDIQIGGGTELQQQKALLANAKRAEVIARRGVAAAAKRVQIALLSPLGTPAQRKAILQKRQKELDAAKQTVVDAINDQKAAQGKIASIQQKAASDAKEKADKAKKARSDADQALLDSFAAPRARITDAMVRAQGADNIALQIKLQQALIAEIKREIRVVSTSVKDVKTKTTQLRTLNSELISEGVHLKELRAQRADAIADMVEKKFSARIAFAQATNNTQMLINILDKEIAALKIAIKKADVTGEALKTLNTRLANLQQQQRDAQDELTQRQVNIAQLRLDLGIGSEQAVINALNKRIAVKRRAYNQAKKDHLASGKLYEELLQAEVDKKNFLNQINDATKKGTTAFDILKQNVETFNTIGGNLIQGNQPFAGPTGFTADVAQWLVALKKPTTSTSLTPTTTPKGKLEINDDRLVRAIDRWIVAVEQQGSGNGTAGTPKVSVVGQRWSAGAFWEARRTQNYLDSNGG